MTQYQMYELTFQGEAPKESHVDIDLESVFEISTGDGIKSSRIVKGFYAGNGSYKVRFYPEFSGTYTWKVKSEIALKGNLEGTVACESAVHGKQGIIRAVGKHFEYEDGTLYHPFGTTIYALAHQEKERIEETYKTLENAPFNKVRHCVFPKSYDYNHNEPDIFAFEKDTDGGWDVHHPNFAFWDHLESVIFRLAKLGIQSDLILFHPYDRWGFAEMTREQNLIYLNYIVRRFNAIPEIWWSIANEFDLCFHKNMEDWYAFEEYIAEHDPYHHLLSNHNCFSFYDFNRPNITHCCLQTTQVESATKWLKEWQKPIVYDECCYEGDLSHSWGNISGFEMANRFWIACTQGTYATHGEVFWEEDEVLWWSKGGVLKGESPKRIAFLKELIEEFPDALETWEVNPMEGLDEEMIKSILDTPFATLPQRMPESQQESHLVKDTSFRGRCKEQIFLQYMARHCNRFLDWSLPEDKLYQIEVIDMWLMKRQTVMNGVSGIVKIELPGKEGIAVLAVQQ